MNDLMTFNFDGATVRTVAGAAGEPWFVASDVCAILDLVNPRSSLALLDDDERGVHSIHTLGGAQESTIISEAGMYSLVLRSRKPEAKRFKKWVTSEVLPSIRKTGSYGTSPAVAVPQTLPEALRLAADLAEGKAQAEDALALAAPKAEALDLISAGDDALTFTQAAKVLGIKRDKLTSHMHAQGWIYRQNASWVAYQQHIQNGRLLYKKAHFTDAKTGQAHTNPYCHILPKGLTKLAQHFAVLEVA